MAVEVFHEPLEILDRDASARAAAGHAGQVRGAEPEFDHARLHARGQIGGPAGVGGNGQALDRRFDFVRVRDFGLGCAFFLRLLGSPGRHGTHRLRRRFLGFEITHAVGVLLGNIEVSKDGADRVTFTLDRAEFDHRAVARGDDSHDGLVRLDFHHIRVSDHGVAGLGDEADDGGLGDGLAELGHEQGNAGHDGSIG